MKNLPRILTAALIIFTASGASALDVPELTGRVNDYAGMITSQTENLLEHELTAFEKSDSTQVVILTVDSLEGDQLEDFTIRVAETWKIGQTKKDNGVILFVSKNDRRMRIEVGRGLEGVLTDLLAGRILDNVIRPKFRAGDFDGGFTAGTDAIIQACRGEFKNDSSVYNTQKKGSLVERNLLLIFFLLYFLIIIVSKISKLIGGGIGAIALPSIIHFGMGPIGIAGSALFALIGFIIALILPYLPVFGISSGGGSGGSSSFRGGFSGGGGSFGGGGSSGGW